MGWRQRRDLSASEFPTSSVRFTFGNRCILLVINRREPKSPARLVRALEYSSADQEGSARREPVSGKTHEKVSGLN